ncbi:hypothetical protein DFH06DRAFT_1133938 [Mycena polygramma]|nr:hypothetical protein DFH06DRAFT_1133938 [Mycena polygramma]
MPAVVPGPLSSHAAQALLLNRSPPTRDSQTHAPPPLPAFNRLGHRPHPPTTPTPLSETAYATAYPKDPPADNQLPNPAYPVSSNHAMSMFHVYLYVAPGSQATPAADARRAHHRGEIRTSDVLLERAYLRPGRTYGQRTPRRLDVCSRMHAVHYPRPTPAQYAPRQRAHTRSPFSAQHPGRLSSPSPPADISAATLTQFRHCEVLLTRSRPPSRSPWPPAVTVAIPDPCRTPWSGSTLNELAIAKGERGTHRRDIVWFWTGIGIVNRCSPAVEVLTGADAGPVQAEAYASGEGQNDAASEEQKSEASAREKSKDQKSQGYPNTKAHEGRPDSAKQGRRKRTEQKAYPAVYILLSALEAAVKQAVHGTPDAEGWVDNGDGVESRTAEGTMRDSSVGRLDRRGPVYDCVSTEQGAEQRLARRNNPPLLDFTLES